MKALRLLPSLRVRSLWRLASAYCRCIAWLRSHGGSMLPRCAWTLLIRCRPFPGFGAAENRSSPKFTGLPFHAPLPRSRTPAGRAATGLSRRLPHGPRWVYGEDSRIGAFVAHSRGFGAHCQRFVPASRLTTHDSFTAAWLHALPCGISTRWAPSQSFFFFTVFFHMCFGFLSVCALLGAKTPSHPVPAPRPVPTRPSSLKSNFLADRQTDIEGGHRTREEPLKPPSLRVSHHSVKAGLFAGSDTGLAEMQQPSRFEDFH